MKISFKGRHYPKAVILQAVRWYIAYSLSYRDIEELMQERGVDVDHATVQRWVVEFSPKLEKVFRQRKLQREAVCVLMRRISKLKGNGNTCIEPWINRGKQLIFY